MYAILNVLKDGRPTKLCFANKKSAESFLLLVNTYEDDSGAGNGYSAYWPDYIKRNVLPSFFRPRGSVTELYIGLIEAMLWSIYMARAGVPPKELKETFSAAYTGKGIVFSLKELPPRIRPTAGDMYRIPRSLSEDGLGSEGKVIEDNGDNLKVIPCWFWKRDGFRSDVKILVIKASQTMKIHDWLKDMYPERKSWVFDPTVISAKKINFRSLRARTRGFLFYSRSIGSVICIPDLW